MEQVKLTRRSFVAGATAAGALAALSLTGCGGGSSEKKDDGAKSDGTAKGGGSFAVIDMGDDGNVTYVFAFCLHKNRNPFFFLLYKCVKTFFRDTIFQFTTFFADYKELQKFF